MITINQLLESVDLDFEPRWVTKDMNGYIQIWHAKPRIIADGCWGNSGWRTGIPVIKLAEFDGKDWTECIYEIKRKKNIIQKLGKLNVSGSNMTMNQNTVNQIVETVNMLVDEVNKINTREDD